MTGDQDERLRKLRHDIANPLAAMLAETQLLLMKADSLDEETVRSLREIESLARRMREILQPRS
jgi:signal transduction histidine kinase